jgi:Putative lumazine-binding
VGRQTGLGDPDEYIAECQEAVAEAGRYDWRIDGISFEGDTAHVMLGAQYAGVCCRDDLSLVKDDDTWRIVHKTYYVTFGERPLQRLSPMPETQRDPRQLGTWHSAAGFVSGSTSYGPDYVDIGIWESGGLTPAAAMQIVGQARPA